jgi:hypothetical protein
MSSKLKKIVDEYMHNVSGIEKHCERCLKTERWDGNVVLMIVDAAFTSIGLNYFTAVVPKIEEFNREFIDREKIRKLKDLVKTDINELRKVWKNKRSWEMAQAVALYLSNFMNDDKLALITWAKNADFVNWDKDPIGKIRGVGINTFQYLRMMGGVDTVMPDKIVKRVINEILEKAGELPVNNDIKFIEKAEEVAVKCGYKPVELCWMTWMIQPEGKLMRMKKYSKILQKI